MSGMSLLTKELYAAMQHGVTCFYMPCAGRFNETAYYFRSDTHKRCTKQAKALIKAGLVEKYDEDWRGHSLRVLKKWERYRDRLKNGEKSAAAMHEYLRAFEFHKSIDIIERCINDLLAVVEKENFLATSINDLLDEAQQKG
jgi:mevalonate pyrophosphate decarboxylase